MSPLAESVLRQHRRTASSVSVASFSSVTSVSSLDLGSADSQQYRPRAGAPPTVQLTQHSEWSANRKRLTACSLRSRSTLRRADSGGHKATVEKEVEPCDYTRSLSSGECTLMPGLNKLQLTAQVQRCSHLL